MNSPRSTAIKRLLKFVFLPILAVALPVGSYALYTRATGNFHEVTKGVVYRSGQLSEANLAQHASQLGIKSVVNLRGKNAGKDWYDAEVAYCERSGIRHYDFPLSAGQDLAPKQMTAIVDALKNAPKPILIHCKDGADRAALGSALYHFAIEGKSSEEADRELTIWYGHIPMITPHVAAMDRSFWRYVHAQQE